jgi:hypothetical protein
LLNKLFAGRKTVLTEMQIFYSQNNSREQENVFLSSNILPDCNVSNEEGIPENPIRTSAYTHSE